MALPELKKLLEGAAYSPRSLSFAFDAEKLWPSLSARAHGFLWIATGMAEPGPVPFDRMYGRVWADDPDTMTVFDSLNRDEQAEVLAVYTYEIHELTHHSDYLITPYGFNIHGKLLREYVAFQRFVPLLLADPRPAGCRLVDWDPLTGKPRSDRFRDAWTTLRDIVHTLEAFGDGGMLPRAEVVTKGWSGETRPFTLFMRSLQRVTVRGFLTTVTVPDESRWYLRPATILETRGLVHSLLWILHLFGGGNRARGPLLTYLHVFYDSAMIPPDYNMLLAVIASGWGFDSFHQFVEKEDMAVVRSALAIADASCWYALQAPPPMPDTSAFANPVVRLLLALAYFIGWKKEDRFFPAAADALAAMDTRPEARALSLRPIETILAFCERFIEAMQSINSEIVSPVFRGHFQHVLEVQRRQLTFRRRGGYVSYVGMPEDGHPARGLQSYEESRGLAFRDYVPDARIVEWFAFRQQLLYGFVTTDDLQSKLPLFF